MADSDSVDSEEKQDPDTSVDNVCYDKIHIKQSSGKNASVELTDVMGRGSAENKEEQDVATSVDNVCYEKIPCKRGSAAVEEAVMMDESSVDSKEQDMGTSVDNTCYEKLQSRWYLLWSRAFYLMLYV